MTGDQPGRVWNTETQSWREADTGRQFYPTAYDFGINDEQAEVEQEAARDLAEIMQEIDGPEPTPGFEAAHARQAEIYQDLIDRGHEPSGPCLTTPDPDLYMTPEELAKELDEPELEI